MTATSPGLYRFRVLLTPPENPGAPAMYRATLDEPLLELTEGVEQPYAEGLTPLIAISTLCEQREQERIAKLVCRQHIEAVCQEEAQ